jgi:signal peptidase I
MENVFRAERSVDSNQTPERKKKKESLLSRNVMIWARDVAIALLIAMIIMQFIKPTIVRQQSMESTLHPNDYIFLSKQAYAFGDVKSGDIVVFHSNLESDDGLPKNLIKRVIGLPGDVIEIRSGLVYRNNEALSEPYLKDGYTEGDMQPVTVPAGAFFLMGDNRQKSKDSRDPEVGFVAESELLGKAIFRLFPLQDFGAIK